MTSSSSSPPRSGARRTRRVMVLVVGALIDICGVVNVPGAAVLPPEPGGEATITGLGTALATLAICAWLTVLWSDRYPLLPLMTGGVLAVIGLSYVLLLVGAVAYVRQKPAHRRVTGVLTVIALFLFIAREAFTPWGAALPWFLTSRSDVLDGPGWVVASVACAVISLAIAASVAAASLSRDRAERSDQRAAAEVHRADELTVQAAQQAERERIARDMHDALAHRLSVVSLHAGALEAAAGQGDASAMARTVREQTHAALQDMRDLIGELRTPGDDSPPAGPATMRGIGSMLSGLRSTRAMTSVVVIESPERASALFDSAVYRIVQEAITNAIKHAEGETVDVFVHVDPVGGARLRIVNPLGVEGAGGAPGGGNGILGIRERANALGGEAWIGAFEGSFIVDVSLPWQERG